ncbi:hypothetical protein DFH08DRAFT_850328, partial [Mycena albidolilacea]
WRAELVLLGHHSLRVNQTSRIFLEVVGPKMKCCREESYALDWLGGVVSKFCVCIALAWMLFLRWHMLSVVSWTTLSLARTVGYHAYSLQFWSVDERFGPRAIRMRVKGASTTKAFVGVAVLAKLAKNPVGVHIVFVLDSGTARQTQADLDKVDDTKASETRERQARGTWKLVTTGTLNVFCMCQYLCYTVITEEDATWYMSVSSLFEYYFTSSRLCVTYLDISYGLTAP